MFSVAKTLKHAGLFAVCATVALGAGLQISAAEEKESAQPVQTTATFGDWTVRCRKVSKQNDKLCEMIQVVPAKNKQGAIANLAVGRLPGDEKIRLVIQLPIGVHLPSDVDMKIGDEAIAKAEFQSCYSSFCLARADLDVAALKRMKDAKSMTVSFKDRAEKNASISVSLSGFTAAHNETFNAGS